MAILAIANAALAAAPELALDRNPLSGELTLRWTGAGVLQESPEVGSTGAFVASGNQSNPQTLTLTAKNRFFRILEANAQAWIPPVGIPYPPMGITNSHWVYTNANYRFDYGNGPEPYRVNEFGPYTHYIDNTAPNATDNANPFGSPALPRRTWVYPLPEGALVQVRRGVYSFNNAPSSSMAAGGQGTEQRPIFIYGTTTNRDEMPIVSRTTLYAWGNWTYLEKFKFTNGCSVNTRPQLKGAPVTNVVVRDCYLTAPVGIGGTAFTTGGSSGNSATNFTQDFVIFRNVAHGYGDWKSAVENDSCGAILSENATNIWLLENTMYNFGGDSCRIGADQGGSPSGGNYYLGRNHFYDNRENALDVKQARNAVVSENIMHGFRASSSSAGEAIVIHYAPRNIWFLNNTVYDSERGFNSSGVGGDCYIIGNLVYDCSLRGIYLDRGGGTFHVVNNTVASCGAGIITSGTVVSLTYINNIVTDLTDPAGYHLQLESPGIAAASFATNFMFFQQSGSVRIRWGAATYTSVAAWMTGSGKGTGSTFQDPKFENARNYRLMPDSPAINAGAPIPDYPALLRQNFGVIVQLKDIDGQARVDGSSIDIGADEFQPVAP